MSSRRSRWAALAGAGLLALAVPLLGQTPSASAAACSTSSGVSVVVGASVGCAPGHPSSALAALQAAGHSVTMVARFPGAVCRIDGTPAADPCVVMPPSSAYWSFWTATRGGTWRYASSAVAAYHPAPGTVVGFAFGSGAPPAAAPPPAPRPAPTTPRPTPSHTPTTHGTTHATTRPGPTARVSQTPGSGATVSTAPPSASPAGTGPSASAPTALGPTREASAATPLPGSGALSAGIGAGLVLGLVAAAAYVVRRRRV